MEEELIIFWLTENEVIASYFINHSVVRILSLYNLNYLHEGSDVTKVLFFCLSVSRPWKNLWPDCGNTWLNASVWAEKEPLNAGL